MQFNEYLVGSPIDRRVAEWFVQSDVAPESPFFDIFHTLSLCWGDAAGGGVDVKATFIYNS